jgi:hypothetical protein
MSEKMLNVVTESALIPATIHIVYKKSVLETDHEREIEPYSLSQGKQDVMLRAFQVTPAPGWRFFMLHKICGARPGRPFQPRRSISITRGVVHETFEPWANWTTAVQGYRNMVRDVLADMEVTDGEREALERFRVDHSISRAQMRAVHYSLFQQCLGTMLSDGLVEDSEIEHACMLNDCLDKCGAGVP